MSQGVCVFCKAIVGHRKRTRLLLKHAIWISGIFETCPGTGIYATPIPELVSAGAKTETEREP